MKTTIALILAAPAILLLLFGIIGIPIWAIVLLFRGEWIPFAAIWLIGGGMLGITLLDE